MSDTNKYREFWIHATGMAYNFDVMSDSPTIHVVEVKALKYAQAEIAERWKQICALQNLKDADIKALAEKEKQLSEAKALVDDGVKLLLRKEKQLEEANKVLSKVHQTLKKHNELTKGCFGFVESLMVAQRLIETLNKGKVDE